MKRPYLAVGIAAVAAVATLVYLPASAAPTAPVAQATTAPPSDVRELPVDAKYSTAELGLDQVSARTAAPE